jgi:membrane-bound metal-dependent hydrolase YbcI (DUF457 family)
MRGRHHAICGAAVAAPALLYLTQGSIGAVVVGVPIATLGAMLPDIDTRRFPLQGEVWRGWKRLAKTARARGPLGMPFALAAIIVGALMAGALSALSWLVRRVVSHRGFTHTIFCTAIIGLVATWASVRLVGSWVPGIALVIGYASHLITDAMTYRGVDVFEPLIPVTVHLLPPGLRFGNGGVREGIAVFTIVVAAILGIATAYARFGPRL